MTDAKQCDNPSCARFSVDWRDWLRVERIYNQIVSYGVDYTEKHFCSADCLCVYYTKIHH